MTDFAHPTPASLPDYRGKARKSGLLSLQSNDSPQVYEGVREELGLFMNAAQLRIFTKRLRQKGTPLHAEVLYLLDSLCELHATRADTQTLMGFDTARPEDAEALSTLIDHCRARTRSQITPPLQLRTVLDALQKTANEQLPATPYDSDASLHWQLCDAMQAAALRAQGAVISAQLDIADSALQLVCCEPQRHSTDRRILHDDTLLLIHGSTPIPDADTCAAAQHLLEPLARQGTLRCLRAVAPGMLLPVALRCVGGLSLRAALPSEMVRCSNGGWLAVVPPDSVPLLEQACHDTPLSVLPVATARKDRKLAIPVTDAPSPILLDPDLLMLCEAARTDDLTAPEAPATDAPIYPTALYLRRGTDAAGGRLCNARGCGSWYVRTVTIPLEEAHPYPPIHAALDDLAQALREDGCCDLSCAALSCGLEIREDLPRNVRWSSVLQLHRAAQAHPFHLLPIALHHSISRPSQITLTLICHKQQPDISAASQGSEAQSEASRPAPLPLPAACSLVHTASPAVLLVCMPSAGNVDATAAVLKQAGATVSMLSIASGEAHATALADAILTSNLVMFLGDHPALPSLLCHRRVAHALEQLAKSDGLCLIHGASIHAFCRAGLFGEMLQNAELASPEDTCQGAFPYALGYVRDLTQPELPATLRALPHQLPLLGDELPVGDEIIEAFLDPDLQSRQILAVAKSEDARTVAVRIVSHDAHRIAFADGFTFAQLQAALAYFL